MCQMFSLRPSFSVSKNVRRCDRRPLENRYDTASRFEKFIAIEKVRWTIRTVANTTPTNLVHRLVVVRRRVLTRPWPRNKSVYCTNPPNLNSGRRESLSQKKSVASATISKALDLYFLTKNFVQNLRLYLKSPYTIEEPLSTLQSSLKSTELSACHQPFPRPPTIEIQ